MSVMTTGNFSKLLWPGIKKIHGDTYNAHKTEYTEIFKKESSDKAYEEYQGLSGFGLAQRKPEGEGVAFDTMRQGYTTRATNVVYALGFIITREAYDDDQYGKLAAQRSRALAKSMRQTKEIVGANIINRAFTSGYTYGDGKVLCATDHPNVAGGTFSNTLAVASDLNQAALEQMAIDLMNFTDDRGLKIAVMPRKLLLHPSETFNAERILKSALEYDTANNAINALKSKNVFPEGIAVNHYLTDPDAFFILTDQEGLVYQERRADEFEPTAENDWDTENARFKASSRYTFTAFDPRAIYGSPGA
jgi:phage major head subunit gpT-like protein